LKDLRCRKLSQTRVLIGLGLSAAGSKVPEEMADKR
jgi:hypothetical protein